MKQPIKVKLTQKEIALIQTSLMFYKGFDDWFSEEENKEIEKLKEKLTRELTKTIKFKKIKEDDLPF